MAEDMHITIREALPGDADDFAEMVLLSSPGLFPAIYGGGVRDLMRYLFRQRGNLFSFEHACFAELDGKKAGMILGYDWRAKRRESWRTGYLLLKHMKGALSGKIPLMMKVNGVVGMVEEGEYNVSNIGVYPQYRGRRVGTRLILGLEERAVKKGAARSALDVEVENVGALRLYSRLGYETMKESSVKLPGNKVFRFYRMRQQLK
jgi:ribosomal protein S18 acetylase RimI-like enzyme